MPTRSLWRNRDYLLLWGGQVVSSIGSQVSQLAFPLLMLALTSSPFQAGLLGAARALPYFLFALPAGALVDRWDRKRLMILCDMGRAVLLGSIPLAFLLGQPSVLQLYVVSLLEGSLFVFFNIAESSCLPRVVPPEQLPEASAQSQLIDAVAGLAGPSFGGALFGWGLFLPFLTDAASYAASTLSLLFIRTRFQDERPAAPRALRVEIAEGLRWLWGQRLVRFITLMTGSLALFSNGQVLVVILLARQMQATSFTTGLVFTGGGVGSIVGALIAAPLLRRVNPRRLYLAAAWGWGLTWGLYAFAPSLPMLALADALGFMIVSIYHTVAVSLRLALTPDALQGRVNSIARLIAYGCQPLGMVLTGALLDALGPRSAVLWLTLPQLLLALSATFNALLRQMPSLSDLQRTS